MTAKKDIESKEKLARVLNVVEDRADAQFENWIERYPSKIPLSKHLRMARKSKQTSKSRQFS
jgi:hypothetical protein